MEVTKSKRKLSLAALAPLTLGIAAFALALSFLQ